MKLRTILAASAIAALAAPAAAMADVQPPPVNGGTEVGGVVGSFLELGIVQPAKGFASFSKAKSYEMSFDALATATDGSTLLSIADGDATSGSKLGHLSVGSKRLASPLEATVGKAAFQPLDASTDPLLNRWSDVMTKSKATVKLRQKVTKKATGTYHKLVLVTLSTETP
jgi:hypothetical protein